MVRFLVIIILTFSFQSLAKADNIRDFQIEGISIGDSLLEFSSENEIKRYMISDYKSKLYSRFTLRSIFSSDLEIYDDIQVHFKTNDKNFIIASISGGIYYENEFNKCLKKKELIIEEISSMFPNARVNDQGTSPWLAADETGKTITSQYFFNFGSQKYNDYIEIACYDWGEEAGKKFNAADHLKVGINTKSFEKWLVEKAW